MAKKLIVGENDLETTNPKVAKTLHPTLNGNITARDITANSHKKLWWICEHGHVWEAIVANRNKGTGCPVCSGRIVITGVNDFGSKHPELLVEWDEKKNKGISPFQIAEYSNKKFHWKKMLRSPITGRMKVARWEDTVAHRVQGRGCPYESGQKVLRGYNDFPSFASPEIMAEWDYEKNGDLDPYSLTYGSNQKVWWKCEKGHSWYASIDNRIRKHTGCPTCNESHGEKAVEVALTKLGILFEREYKFEDCYFQNSSQRLRLDFALMSGNTVVAAIEYHGEQHYTPVDFGGKGTEAAQAACELTQARDSVKSEYLKSHNIPQLIIPYTEFDNIQKLVSDFVDETVTITGVGGMGMATDKKWLRKAATKAGWKCIDGRTLCPECAETAGKLKCSIHCPYLAQCQEEYDDEPMGYCCRSVDMKTWSRIFLGSVDEIRNNEIDCLY